MKLSIGIPAYNRPAELGEALESLALDCTAAVEIVVSEDRSPRGGEIRRVVEDFSRRRPHIAVRFFENETNLGYDGNLRSLLEKASGDYIFFMGDDDRVVPGALGKVLRAVDQPGVGIVLRAWRSFDTETNEILDVHHYFNGDRIFPPGAATVAAFFRRSVFISGLTVHRSSALAWSTPQFDGLLLYQLYLVGVLLRTMKGYYIDSIVVERRCGNEHFFGSSATEAARFEPNKLDTAHSVRFLSGLFQIAEYLERDNPGVFPEIRKDLGRYSYPMLEIQAVRQSRVTFAGYGYRLARIGLGRSLFFWIYLGGLLVLGPRACHAIIGFMLQRLGSTPVLAGASGSTATSATEPSRRDP